MVKQRLLWNGSMETAEQIKRIVDVNLQEPCSRCHILYDMCGDLLKPEYKATGKITRERGRRGGTPYKCQTWSRDIKSTHSLALCYSSAQCWGFVCRYFKPSSKSLLISLSLLYVNLRHCDTLQFLMYIRNKKYIFSQVLLPPIIYWVHWERWVPAVFYLTDWCCLLYVLSTRAENCL